MTWDLLDEDCSDISDWDDVDFDIAVSEVDPAGQFRFDTNSGAAGNAYARRIRDIGSYPNTFTIEIKLYHDAIGIRTATDYFSFLCSQADERVFISFSSDGLYLRKPDADFIEVGTDLVKHGGSAEWQTWRFLQTFTGVTGEGTCDVYLKDSTHDWEKVGTAIPSGRVAVDADGSTYISQFGYTTDDMVTHVDYIKIATGLHIPVVVNAIFFGANFII